MSRLQRLSDPRERRREQDSRVDRFNRIIKTLVNEMAARDPADAKLERARNQVIIATREVPTRVIQTAGPYLYKYKDTILSPDPREAERRLRANTFKKEFDAAGPSEKKETSVYIMERLRGWWDQRSDEEFELFNPALQELTRTYVEYLIVGKGFRPNARPPPALAIFDEETRRAARTAAAAAST